MTIKYCKHDVDCTERLTEIRKNYLDNKVYLGGLKSADDVKSLSMTNAKLTALYVDAQRTVEYTDEREYKYPENLRKEFIPAEVFEFFDRLYDKSISDDDLFKSKLNITVGDCPVTLGFGGIHGAMPFYQEQEQDGRLIRNYDVAFTFNGTAVKAQTTDGQALGTNFFKANTIVECRKKDNVLYFASSSKSIVDDATGSAFRLGIENGIMYIEEE